MDMHAADDVNTCEQANNRNSYMQVYMWNSGDDLTHWGLDNVANTLQMTWMYYMEILFCTLIVLQFIPYGLIEWLVWTTTDYDPVQMHNITVTS